MQKRWGNKLATTPSAPGSLWEFPEMVSLPLHFTAEEMEAQEESETPPTSPSRGLSLALGLLVPTTPGSQSEQEGGLCAHRP